MDAIKMLALTVCIFMCFHVRAGFYVPKVYTPVLIATGASGDTISFLKHSPHYKVKKITKERAVFYAALGLFPPAYLISPSLVCRYLGYRKIPLGYFLLLPFLLGGIGLLFTPWLTSATILLAFYLVFNLALALGEMKQLLSGKLFPINGRYFSKHSFG